MSLGHVTTPFGRRAVTYAMLADQWAAQDVDENAAVDKWQLYRWLCEARSRLGISDRALSLLNALLSFYPKSELLGADNLIVFPSNEQLSLRAHGMAEATIRRHLAALIEAGLLVRRDSANGKRFARRGSEGKIGEAFGFSLSPLLLRAEEIRGLAAEVVAERLHFQQVRERLTICRRDVKKLLDVAEEEGRQAEVEEFQALYLDIMRGWPRSPNLVECESLLAVLEAMRDNISKFLEKLENHQKSDGNAAYSERHIQNSNTKTQNELEPRFETKLDASAAVDEPPSDTERVDLSSRKSANNAQAGGMSDGRQTGEAYMAKPFPLGMVLSACPEIVNFGPSGKISSWRDMMGAAVLVRSMLGISPSAYEEACAILGQENAATVVACILERSGQINSAGGYLRDLTRRAERGEFSLGPMLMAQLRANDQLGPKRA